MYLLDGKLSPPFLLVSSTRAYWPSWSAELDMFLKQCSVCARHYRGTPSRKVAMQTPLVRCPWLCVSLDITGPHPRSSRSNQYILMLVDHFSRWAKAILLRNHTAPTIARVLMVNVFFEIRRATSDTDWLWNGIWVRPFLVPIGMAVVCEAVCCMVVRPGL